MPITLLEFVARWQISTLTNLYNTSAVWLAEPHRKLDEAVVAYGLVLNDGSAV